MPNENNGFSLKKPMNPEAEGPRRQGEKRWRSKDAENKPGLELSQLKRKRIASC